MPSGIYLRTEENSRNRNLAMKGRKVRSGFKRRPMTPETKEKIHQKAIGRKMPPHKRGPRPDTTERCRKLVGKLSPAWKGGLCKNRKEYVRFMANKRMALKKQAIGIHTLGEWETLKIQYNFTCPCCGRREPEINLTEDHIIPLSKGGSNYIENIQPLCRSCNCRKHTKIIKWLPTGEIEALEEQKEKNYEIRF